LIQAFHPGI
jgi:hypothetical protein